MNNHSYSRVQIGSLVSRVETWNPQRATRDVEFDYIDIASIDRESKTVAQPTRVTTHDAPSRARQRVRAKDVLVSTVRPNLNAVALVPDELNDATASTGFCVLRTVPDRLDHRYLFHWVRTPQFIGEMTRLSTGANYPAVSDRIVCDSTIPLPYADDPGRSLPEQKRIAAILDQADAIRRQRRQAIETTAELIPAIFHEMFGDPDRNPHQWDIIPVSNFVSTLQGGKNILTDKSAYSRTRYYILKVSAVTWGDYRPEESKPVPEDFEPPEDYFVRDGDLLMSRANTRELLGATVYVRSTPGNMLLPDKIWRFVWRHKGQVEPLYIHALFQYPSIRSELGRRASGSSGSMKNISKPKVMSLCVPLPPLRLQKRFATSVEQVWRLLDDQASSRRESDTLFDSLVQRAFRGDL